MKTRNALSFLLFFLLFAVSFYVFGQSSIGILSLEVTGIGVRHGTPDNLNLGTINYSENEQIITGVFADYFWIEDLLGRLTGHYTTIQCDGLYNINGGTITGIFIKYGKSNPDLILGGAGGVFNSSYLSTFVSIHQPVVYMYKSTLPEYMGVINKYGDKPELKIVVPPQTTAGTYKGEIVFTLYLQ